MAVVTVGGYRQKKLRAAHTAKDYAHSDWPAMYFGPNGQSAKFNGPLEVPQGWHDSPTKVGKKNAKTVIPGYEEALAEAGGELPQKQEEPDEEDEEQQQADEGEPVPKQEEGEELPAEEEMLKEEIVARLEKAKGVIFNPSWAKGRLYAILADHAKAAE